MSVCLCVRESLSVFWDLCILSKKNTIFQKSKTYFQKWQNNFNQKIRVLQDRLIQQERAVCLSVCLSVRPSVCLSLHVSVHVSISWLKDSRQRRLKPNFFYFFSDKWVESLMSYLCRCYQNHYFLRWQSWYLLDSNVTLKLNEFKRGNLIFCNLQTG